jgi:hypothetical protein
MIRRSRADLASRAKPARFDRFRTYIENLTRCQSFPVFKPDVSIAEHAWGWGRTVFEQ